jgi:hypothetical protein
MELQRNPGGGRKGWIVTSEIRAVTVEVIDLTDAHRAANSDDEFVEPVDPDRTEAASAVRTAALVAPAPPDPDYFVG